MKYIFTVTEYKNGVLSFFKIRLNNFNKAENYKDDEIIFMIKIRIDNNNRKSVCSSINYFN